MKNRVATISTAAIILGLCLLTGCTTLEPDPFAPVEVPLHLYVDATTGSDASGTGSASSPFKTITQALRFLYDIPGVDENRPRPEESTVIHIAAGLYNTNLGEGNILLNKVELEGEGADREDVQIAVEIEAQGPCKLTHVRLYGTIYLREPGDRGPEGEARLEDVRAEMIWVEDYGQHVQVVDCQFDSLHANLVKHVSVINCRIVGGRGIYVAALPGGSIQVEDSLVDDSSDAVVATADNVTVSNCTIRDCFIGLTLHITSGGHYQLSDISVSDCSYGFIVSGQVAGRINVSGRAAVSGSAKADVLDERDAFSGLLEFGAMHWSAPKPSGVVDGPTNGPTSAGYQINSEGNSLRFE